MVCSGPDGGFKAPLWEFKRPRVDSGRQEEVPLSFHRAFLESAAPRLVGTPPTTRTCQPLPLLITPDPVNGADVSQGTLTSWDSLEITSASAKSSSGAS